MQQIIFDESLAGTRLDAALAQELEVPRSRVTRLIKDGAILCNEQKTKPAYKLESGDVATYPETLINPPTVEKEAPPELRVIFEDSDCLVIEKPAGLLVHQTGPEDTSPTVAAALVKKYPEAAEVGDDPARPGIVHRLDKDVSGVMVLAKTQAGFDSLKKQFQDRTVEKEYLALVYGQVSHDHDLIKLKVTRSKAKGRMVARTEEQEGKEALTEYDVIKRYKTATYVKVRIHTGRTHQIRVHFQALGHPVVGDKLYGRNIPTGIRPIILDRIFLHAHRLAFKTLDEEKHEFVSSLPQDLEKMIDKLPTQ